MQVFYRERAALMYDPLVTGLSTVLVELPYIVAQTVLFSPIVYWMVDFDHDASKFFYYFLLVFLNTYMYTAFGIFLVAALPALELAQIMTAALNFLFNIFNGKCCTATLLCSTACWAYR